jgi:hypothetical protein
MPTVMTPIVDWTAGAPGIGAGWGAGWGAGPALDRRPAGRVLQTRPRGYSFNCE